ncbi:hypothetical protein DSO57_1000936 [Entomophthora muscae]|uniref:Uncharacterized protein n=1 Tax=Entomophthora muscae TaxID=34485 RepID=A0ACC2TKJ1_9FUNG|nr:hypothetical protein DSO57_1000936 [Entomophthora muscae]
MPEQLVAPKIARPVEAACTKAAKEGIINEFMRKVLAPYVATAPMLTLKMLTVAMFTLLMSTL